MLVSGPAFSILNKKEHSSSHFAHDAGRLSDRERSVPRGSPFSSAARVPLGQQKRARRSRLPRGNAKSLATSDPDARQFNRGLRHLHSERDARKENPRALPQLPNFHSNNNVDRTSRKETNGFINAMFVIDPEHQEPCVSKEGGPLAPALRVSRRRRCGESYCSVLPGAIIPAGRPPPAPSVLAPGGHKKQSIHQRHTVVLLSARRAAHKRGPKPCQTRAFTWEPPDDRRRAALPHPRSHTYSGRPDSPLLFSG